MTIETDASTMGWGAFCNGARTVGPGSRPEQSLHINCLELLAATLAVKCFAKGRTCLSILLKMDSMSALTYINKMGGTISPELTRLAKELWLWCMERNISLSAEHLPGVLSTIADEESRVMKDRTDGMLCPHVFHQINQRLGPLEIDLFATRLTTQLPTYISWRPDPQAVATNAFSENWSGMKGYANPPWNLIGRLLSQTRKQQTELVLIAPVLRAQPWYPVLLGMLVEIPLLIPSKEDLIQPTHQINQPEVTPQLAVWVISGNNTRSANFRKKLPTSYYHHGDKSLQSHMTPFLVSGSAGAVKGMQIPFQVL